MKTIADCIKENEEFLPSLKVLLNDALGHGEYEDNNVIIFVKTDKDNKPVASKVVTGEEFAVYGDKEGLVDSLGCTIYMLLRLQNHVNTVS